MKQFLAMVFPLIIILSVFVGCDLSGEGNEKDIQSSGKPESRDYSSVVSSDEAKTVISSSQGIQNEQIDILDKSAPSSGDLNETSSFSDEYYEEPVQQMENMTLMETFRAVLQGNVDFFNADDGENRSIDQLDQSIGINTNNLSVTVIRFAIMDLDNDNIPEVVLWLAVGPDEYFGFKVLRYESDMIYGYTLVYRAFSGLKADGVFSFANSAVDNGFATLGFAEDTHWFNEIAHRQSSYDANNNMTITYIVNNENVTEDEYEAVCRQIKDEPAATWYDYTDENIEEMLR